jgi:hypothetical protein
MVAINNNNVLYIPKKLGKEKKKPKKLGERILNVFTTKEMVNVCPV